MKIQEVTIEGYQSHTNSTFRLSPGLTVITGPSDAGKTAIIRALQSYMGMMKHNDCYRFKMQLLEDVETIINESGVAA